MLKKLALFLSGQIKFEISGGRIERLLNKCAQEGITIQDIAASKEGITACVPKRDYKRLLYIAKKENCNVNDTNNYGAFLTLDAYKHRFGILIGAILSAVLILFFQNIIWSIRFDDFTKAQIAEVRECLYNRGIYEGAFANQKDLDAAEKEIVIKSKDLAWITLNFIKGRLIVEKTNLTPKPISFDMQIRQVVASCNGIVRKIDLSGGFLQVCEGQSVCKGDVLVSSTRIDAGGKVQSVNVNAKIFADVEQTYDYVQPLVYKTNVPVNRKKSYYSIKFLGKTIPLYKFVKAMPKSINKTYRYPLNVFGFNLPITVEELQVRDTQEKSFEISQDDAILFARSKVMNVILEDLPETVIIASSEQITNDDKNVYYSIKISARANIAQYLTN
ncbi:MAG: sporulation protein YqfD [Oscillospiraceae bacterium]